MVSTTDHTTIGWIVAQIRWLLIKSAPEQKLLLKRALSSPSSKTFDTKVLITTVDGITQICRSRSCSQHCYTCLVLDVFRQGARLKVSFPARSAHQCVLIRKICWVNCAKKLCSGNVPVCICCSSQGLCAWSLVSIDRSTVPVQFRNFRCMLCESSSLPCRRTGQSSNPPCKMANVRPAY